MNKSACYVMPRVSAKKCNTMQFYSCDGQRYAPPLFMTSWSPLPLADDAVVGKQIRITSPNSNPESSFEAGAFVSYRLPMPNQPSTGCGMFGGSPCTGTK